MDFLCLIFSVYLAYALRLTFFISGGFRKEMFIAAAAYSVTVLLALYVGKIYAIPWPSASVEEYARLFKFYCVGLSIFIIEAYLLKNFIVPRSSLAVLSFAGIILLGGTRASWRLIRVYNSGGNLPRKRTIIIGAGDIGMQLARDILRYDSKLAPVGFIDDEPEKAGLIIAGLRVLGTADDLPEIIRIQGVEVALIAIPSATGAQIRRYIDVLSPFNITVRVLPSLIDIADGQVKVSRLRSVSLEDLLRREPVKLDNPEIDRFIRGKTVLVTGAGGSIGSEMCCQILARGPKELVALGHGEMSIYNLIESLKDAGITVPVRPVIADVADTVTMELVFKKYHPQIVFHAAAHKHVPLMEDNPREALRVNSYGTWNLATLTGRYGVERMVMISTDKAVNPTSVMGATKRIAEKLLLSVSWQYPNTLYMAVRFGNVLGSRGSVVPKFEKQIERGGPVTVTHKDMKRYFMLIPEAVSLVLQAGSMGCGGELFVLDMGEPVNIAEMAETLIRLHGYEPYKDIKIEFTGIRPGEKLYEELFYDMAHVDKTAHDKIFLSRIAEEKESILPQVEKLLDKNGNGEISTSELRNGIFTLAAAERI